MQLHFSFIIPVFNRPEEIKELLESFLLQTSKTPYEIVIIEDGSGISSKSVVESFQDKLHISYYFKKNSGPGDSRNFGMQKAKGNYFIILDSDCLLPENYLAEVENSLNSKFVHCFGGPDEAHESFSNLQKAINFAMTSFISTGGIRGNKKSVTKFQPRSFNMGLSKEAFLATGGFGSIHPGEDPDLSIRLWKKGYKTALMPEAKVFHKRRISWPKFYNQVYKFGLVRPILNSWHPETKKIAYWFPAVFCFGLVCAITLFLFFSRSLLLLMYLFYFVSAFILAVIKTKSFFVAFQAIFAIFVQMVGYGYGFITSTLLIAGLNIKPEKAFPELFFTK
ncbi:MAG TPA: glycosyltransferase [Flavobacteriaceae bacterium]|nr:glycosyltransferase [Flavobacteriaceae bacterium]